MITRQITLTCDVCHAEAYTDIYANEVIRRARQDGWRIGKRHLCPDCLDAHGVTTRSMPAALMSFEHMSHGFPVM
jgi:hypothetical protein